ncbi:MAG: GspE/PulE family protein [Candidatus Eremiobacteraeota bacterium]|nr:GspE/PulE family protein [Candidatus Eremiobacteraeota bacterium]
MAINEKFRLLTSQIDITTFEGFVQVALRLGASDIHFEPMEHDLRVRVRIDGELEEVARMNHSASSSKPHPIIVQIKARSELNLKSRVPEDGRCEIWADDALLSIRVSTIPQVFGEKIVVRLFDKSKVAELHCLGFRDHNLGLLKQMVEKNSGIVLVTGPTGSGKTTTLYTILNYLNNPHRNLITVEDPVEYFLPGINQIQVDPKGGVTFDTALRAILRQDPDILMVGEIRDRETADIAFHAALTGHLVLSTVHANDTIGAIMRVFDLGVPTVLAAQAMNGIISQRLVSHLCPKCRVCSVHPPLDGILTYEPKGCDFCHSTGVRGRQGVQELLVFSDTFRKIMSSTFNSEELLMIALKEGMETLKQDALVKTTEGSISYRDALAITDESLDRIMPLMKIAFPVDADF